MCWRIGAAAEATPATATMAGKSKWAATKRFSASAVGGFRAL